MKKLLFKVSILAFLIYSFSCTNESYLFEDREQAIEVEQNKGALIGQWVLEQENSENDIVLDIQEQNESLILQTPEGEKEIEKIESMGEIGFVLQVTDDGETDNIMAKFKSYERRSLMLMNADDADLGIDSEVPVVLTKGSPQGGFL